MFGFKNRFQTFTSDARIPKVAKVISYNFYNKGDTVVLLRTDDMKPAESPQKIEPGECIDTFIVGGMDQSQYIIKFLAQNDVDANSQQSELSVTYTVGL